MSFVIKYKIAGILIRSFCRRLIEMLWMVIERFKPGATPAVYERFRARGRMLPDGLHYVDSWVETDFGRCFQLMRCDDRALLDEWMARWNDLVDFEAMPVITSDEAARLKNTGLPVNKN